MATHLTHSVLFHLTAALPALVLSGVWAATLDSAQAPPETSLPAFEAKDASGTTREFAERDGWVVIEAEHYTAMTGAWRLVKDDGRLVMRMNGPDGGMFAGRHMYLAYRIRFAKAGRYRLCGLMRSTGTKATDDVWVYWNREPGGNSREDYELKVESTKYQWSAAFKDLPPPEPSSKRPKNRDFAENGFPVPAPGVYTLFLAKGEEPFFPDHTVGTDADFFAFDRFALIHADLLDPTRSRTSTTGSSAVNPLGERMACR